MVTLDCKTRMLSGNGRRTRVRPIGVRIIQAMLAGVQTQYALVDAIWPNPDTSPQDETGNLRVQMRWLRQDFDAIGLPDAILNTRGIGYTLSVPVEVINAVDPIVIPGEFRAALRDILYSVHSPAAERLLEVVG